MIVSLLTVQLFGSLTRHQYDPAESADMIAVVSPLFHEKEYGPLDVALIVNE